MIARIWHGWTKRADAKAYEKISLTARPLDALEPKWDMYVVDEIREAVTAHGHDLGELAINEIQFPTVEPKAAVVTTIENDISQTQKLYRCQIDFYAARTLSRCRTRLVFLLRTKLDAALNLEGKLIQFSRIEPKTAALLTGVVGQLSMFRDHADHIKSEHLNLTVQALHARCQLLASSRRLIW